MAGAEQPGVASAAQPVNLSSESTCEYAWGGLATLILAISCEIELENNRNVFQKHLQTLFGGFDILSIW